MLSLCGMTIPEAAIYLDVSPAYAKSLSSGDRRLTDAIRQRMLHLVARIDQAAAGGDDQQPWPAPGPLLAAKILADARAQTITGTPATSPGLPRSRTASG